MKINMFGLQSLSKSSLRKDVLWTVLTQVTILLCAFAITKIVSSSFSVDGFGLYNIVRRSASVLSFTMLAGTGIALPRYISLYESKGNYSKVLNIINATLVFMVTITIIVVILGWLFKPYLMDVIISSDDDNLYLLTFLYSIGLSASSLLFAYYRGKNNYKQFSISQIALQLIFIISALLCSKSSINSLFLLWGMASSLLTIVYWFYENYKSRFVQFRYVKFDELKKSIIEISKYSAPRLVGDFFLFSFSAFPLLYIGNYDNLANVAYFSVGVTLLHMVSPLFSFLGVILLPYVSRSIANGTFSKTSSAIHKLTLLYVVISIGITLFFWMIMPFLIKVFFSENYLVTTQLSRYIMLALLPQSLYLLYRNPIDAASVTPYNTIVLIISFAILTVLFVFSDNVIDYAFSFVIASFVQGFLSFIIWIYLKRKLSNLENGEK